MKGIFYASSTGNTEEVANKISQRLDDFELIDVASSGVEQMNDFEIIIIGVSTWGEGDLQDDWEDCLSEIQTIDFSGKTVALFGLGDQEEYGYEFVNGMGTMYEIVRENGANVVGFTSTQGYEFDESTAIIDNQFVGLVLDEDNQSDLTDSRIDTWINKIKDFL